MAEMIVAQNSLKTLNQQFDIEDLKKSVEKHVYPNLYKLLQVLNTINNTKILFYIFVPLWHYDNIDNLII